MLIPVLFLCVLEFALRLAGCGYDPAFFKRMRIGNEDCYVQNDDFSLRFFPKETARNPGPVRMKVRKPAGVFRIFVLGESAAMGDPEPAFGPARYLEMLLQDKYPGADFEIENVAFTAINSHVILPIARECARHDGDLWIIYMGNNEMVGPFGAATVFGKQAPVLPYVRLVTSIQGTRIGQLFMAAERKLTHRQATAPSWGGMQMFLDNQVAPNSPLKTAVYRNFQKNLEDIIRASRGSNAKVLLNTVAVNLKDCPPFASRVNPLLSPSDRTRFEELYSSGCQKQGRDLFADAARDFEGAAALDSQSADLQFRWGQCLFRLTNAATAQHLQQACDYDTLPFRADSQINTAIRETAKKLAGNQLVFFDAAAALAAKNPGNLSGRETFYEHVHFDFDGSYRLGLAWAGKIAPLLPVDITNRARSSGWATQERCEHLLGLTDWNRMLVLEQVMGRMQLAPFNSQSNNSQQIAALQKRVAELQARIKTESRAQVKEDFLRVMQAAPDDHVLRENYALFLQSIGELPEAANEWRRIQEMIPQDYLASFEMGRLLNMQKQWSEAEVLIRRSLDLRSTLTDGWYELGNAQSGQEKYADALESYTRALQQRPQDAATCLHLGMVLGRLERHDEAVHYYRQAAKFNPSLWEPHFKLGGELDSAGHLEEASEEFGEAARLNRDFSRTHFNHAVLLAKLGRLDEARHEFEETLRLEPGNAKARGYLTQLQSIKRSSQ